MFSKFALFIVASLVALTVVAGPVPAQAGPAGLLSGLTGPLGSGGVVNGAPSTGGVTSRTDGTSQCDVEKMKCCSSVHESDSPAGAFLLASVLAPIQNVVTTVGFNCAPIAAGIVGGAAATGSKW
jgi:hypothetical protein